MPEIQNDYYSIAVNDYQFLAAALHTGLYNQISGGKFFNRHEARMRTVFIHYV